MNFNFQHEHVVQHLSLSPIANLFEILAESDLEYCFQVNWESISSLGEFFVIENHTDLSWVDLSSCVLLNCTDNVKLNYIIVL